MEKWLGVHRTKYAISLKWLNRAKFTINGLYEVVYELSIAANMSDLK